MRAGSAAICGEMGVSVAVREGELREPDLVCCWNDDRLAAAETCH